MVCRPTLPAFTHLCSPSCPRKLPALSEEQNGGSQKAPESAGTSWGACSTTCGTGVTQPRAEEPDPLSTLENVSILPARLSRERTGTLQELGASVSAHNQAGDNVQALRQELLPQGSMQGGRRSRLSGRWAVAAAHTCSRAPAPQLPAKRRGGSRGLLQARSLPRPCSAPAQTEAHAGAHVSCTLHAEHLTVSWYILTGPDLPE